MTYADIVVKVDSSEESDRTLEVGIELSRQFNAHLTAIHPIQLLTMLPYTGMAGDAVVIQNYTHELEEQAEATGKKCRKLADEKLVRLDWQAPVGMPNDLIEEAGRLVDLVILPQGNQTEFESVLRGLSEDVLLSIGRPTLIVPYIGCQSMPFKRILVAWDGSQAAARALSDAMPFLLNAEHVEVTTAYEARKNTTTTTNNNENICAHLLRHGIGTESTSIPYKAVDIGNTILNHVSDTGADLLVMGAYGHSRLREIVLGGATRTLLRSLTVPVLMSH